MIHEKNNNNKAFNVNDTEIKKRKKERENKQKRHNYCMNYFLCVSCSLSLTKFFFWALEIYFRQNDLIVCFFAFLRASVHCDQLSVYKINECY